MQLLHLRLRDLMESRAEASEKPEEQEACWEIMCTNVRNYVINMTV